MYRILLNALMDELSESGLSQLPSDFYINVQAYLHSLKDKLESASDIDAKLIEAEAKLASEIVSTIVALRLRKILKHLLSGNSGPPPNLLDVELEAFEKIYAAVEDFLALAEKFASLEKGVLAKKILVRFIREVPAFVGADLKTYGPFKPEDVANIPLINAEALVRRKMVEILG
ncbi:MAG: hypothetical protein NDF54_02575 [archaeon GB-1867-035]|nr:hypothetical protein [Candidatus Culexmicrobium profundum]